MTTLLIVDDEPNVLRSLALSLEMEGFEVRVASNAREALASLEGVDLVLTDLSMPDMDGIELLQHIRRSKPNLPVAMMTAHVSVELALEAMQAGAYDYLLKPIHGDEIILKVKLGLKLSRYEHELRARNEELERKEQELEEANRRLELANEQLRRLAATDSLTGLPNRRRFMERLMQETANSRRYHHRLSLILIDVDHFKRINDTYGHPVGDRVLADISSHLMDRARETDLPARIGGEEFAVILTSTHLEGAKELAEDIRERIATHHFDHVGRVTISLGVGTYDPGDEKALLDPHGEKLLATADAALYRAKSLGRNRVETA